MGNKKYIVIAAVLAMLGGVNPALANASNSLMQMDVKKSSATDTVDVTFYTTDGSSSSVVTRKSANRYVVLLPNTDSSSSVAPGIGGVKDLITDINVKHVNDGIGGYTKITFGTTKPINIRTIVKKANPVFQAQKDYQNILAQNNAKSEAAKKTTTPAVKTPASAAKTEAKPAVQNTTPVKPAQTAQKTSAPKQSVEKPVSNIVKTAEKQVQKPKTQVQNEKPTPKVDLSKQKPKTEPVKQPQKTVQPEVQKNTTPPTVNSDNNTPKMKFDKDGKRVIDLEPRVSHVLDNSGPFGLMKNSKQQNVEEDLKTAETLQDEASVDTAATAATDKHNAHFPMWLLIAGGSILALGVMFFVLSVLLASAKKNKRNESFFKVSSVDKHKIKRGKYDNIVNNVEMNWQEKYKQYTKAQEQTTPVKKTNDISYVTNLSGTQKSIIPAINTQESKQQNTVAKPVLKHVKKSAQAANKDNKNKKISKPIGIKSISTVSKREEFKNQMRAKISQMEHALAQTPTLKEPEEAPKGVRSEDNTIISKISDVKLKSFARPISLKETNRSLAQDEKQQSVSKNQIYKESQFVALEDSPLSVSKRQSASTELNVSNLIDTGNKYLKNNGEMKMNKENENYLLSSLDEYLSILDGEETSRTNVISAKDSLAQVKSSSEAMSRSGISNPISRTSNPISAKTPTPYMNGLIVKSGYNIDSEKGFYLVNIDGVSALVGRINDSIFILKKFDRVIDKPLQVRHDDGSVYIVRAGGYKCLVDVSKDKMGTLIEI